MSEQKLEWMDLDAGAYDRGHGYKALLVLVAPRQVKWTSWMPEADAFLEIHETREQAKAACQEHATRSAKQHACTTGGGV